MHEDILADMIELKRLKPSSEFVAKMEHEFEMNYIENLDQEFIDAVFEVIHEGRSERITELAVIRLDVEQMKKLIGYYREDEDE